MFCRQSMSAVDGPPAAAGSASAGVARALNPAAMAFLSQLDDDSSVQTGDLYIADSMEQTLQCKKFLFNSFSADAVSGDSNITSFARWT